VFCIGVARRQDIQYCETEEKATRIQNPFPVNNGYLTRTDIFSLPQKDVELSLRSVKPPFVHCFRDWSPGVLFVDVPREARLLASCGNMVQTILAKKLRARDSFGDFSTELSHLHL
jgi:hypothetical protein